MDIKIEFDTPFTCIPKYDPSEIISEPHINLKSNVKKTKYGITPLSKIIIIIIKL